MVIFESTVAKKELMRDIASVASRRGEKALLIKGDCGE